MHQSPTAFLDSWVVLTTQSLCSRIFVWVREVTRTTSIYCECAIVFFHREYLKKM